MSEAIFYSFRRCPYAMRARMAIAISQTPVELREVALRDKPEEMLAASPKGTVPVLVTDGAVIDESLDVMDWALSRNDPEGWLDTPDRSLIETCDGTFKHHLDRYKYASRYDDDTDSDYHRAQGMDYLRQLEGRLQNSPFLNGETRRLNDIAIFPFVRQFRIADKDWFDAAPLPRVQKWLAGLMSADLFKSIMKKYPTFRETGEGHSFP